MNRFASIVSVTLLLGTATLVHAETPTPSSAAMEGPRASFDESSARFAETFAELQAISSNSSAFKERTPDSNAYASATRGDPAKPSLFDWWARLWHTGKRT